MLVGGVLLGASGLFARTNLMLRRLRCPLPHYRFPTLPPTPPIPQKIEVDNVAAIPLEARRVLLAKLSGR